MPPCYMDGCLKLGFYHLKIVPLHWIKSNDPYPNLYRHRLARSGFWARPAARDLLGTRSETWWWWPIPSLELVSRSNKGGGPRVSLALRWRFAWCVPSLIWSECRVPKGSTDELHWARDAWRLLDRMSFGHAYPCFFWLFDFIGSATKLCCLLMKSEAENDMKVNFLRTSIGGLSLMVMRNLLGVSWLVAAASASGGRNTREMHTSMLQGKDPRSGLS
jgi:hypothetical protein